jgi:4'-phosphopantetheinyl transferase
MTVVDLWLVCVRDVCEQLMHRYLDQLDSEERARAGSYKRGAQRREYVISRMLLRNTLSEYAAIQPQEWRFVRTLHGRPEITREQAVDAPLAFSLSHTSEMIALVVCRRQLVGVDIERIRNSLPHLSIANRFFAGVEASDLRKAREVDRPKRLCELWTLKESYLKARGVGLTVPLDTVAFTFPRDGCVDMRLDAVLNDVATRWTLWQLRPANDHIVSICVERTNAGLPLAIRRCVPLQSCHLVNMPVMRCSDHLVSKIKQTLEGKSSIGPTENGAQ